MRFRFMQYDENKRNLEHLRYVEKNAPRVLAWRQKHADILSWHRWFAWRPVAVNYMRDDYRWLETIERKATPYQVSAGILQWDYRDVGDA